jgi:type 2 lantibiotic biosynthesis protein LanM
VTPAHSVDFQEKRFLITHLDERLILHGLPWHVRLALSKGERPQGMELEGDPLQEWRSLIERSGLGAFSRRLDWAGLGDAGAQHLVELHQGDTAIPEWLMYLHEILDSTHQGGEPLDDTWFTSVDAQLIAMMRPGSAPIPYAHALWPLADEARKRVQQQVFAAQGDLPGVLPSAWNDLTVALVARLSTVLSRALQEHRESTPYQSFCTSLVSDGMSTFLWEYPVSGRLISVLCQQWEVNATTLIERVTADRVALEQEFDIAAATDLEAVEWALSDPHRGGATVAILRFTGESRPVVYKPKDLHIERAYHEFTQDILSKFRDLNSPRVHTVGHAYGYASFVTHEPCDEQDLPDFYRQAGRTMALLHFLGASDCHFENLIAHGTELTLIDAETLFEVQLQVLVAQVQDQVPENIDGWILSLGMLPTPRAYAAGDKLFDASALGVPSASGHADLEERAWINVNTDAMMSGVRTVQQPQPGSLPVPAGTQNPVVTYVNDLVAGFTEIYKWAMSPENREHISDRLVRFEGLRRRIVLRNTSLYAILQQRATSPRALRSALTRGFELDRLVRSSLVHQQRTPLWDVFYAELEAMERWDVPYFDFDLGVTTIRESEHPIDGIMNENGIKKATEKLEVMCEEDLDWQVSLIRAAISLCDYNQSVAEGDVRSPVQPVDVVAAVREVSLEDRLGTPTWLIVDYTSRTGERQLDLMKQDLYGGQAGDSDLLEFAQRACEPVLRVLDDSSMRFRLQRDSGLGISGYGGVLRLMELFSNQGWNPRVGSMLPQAVALLEPTLIASDSGLDVISGIAGSLPVVARVSAQGEHGTDLAALMARRLMEQQDASGGWILASPGIKNQRPLTGLAHGASGMGLALLEAGVVLADDRMVEAGARAFAYEDSVFDHEVGNWPDFRGNDADRQFMSGWCAGAPGIGLARMRALDLLPNHPDAPLWQLALENSAHSMIGTGVGVRDHVCCGNMGRVAALGLMGQAAGRPDWVIAGNQIAEQVRDRALAENGFALGPGGNARAGLDTPYLIPGFMQGLSGIAFTSLVGATSPALRSLLV